MKKSIILIFIFQFFITIQIIAQTTAMQFSGTDCNGNNVDLFADLDAGKAVILHFYMPNCGSCPPSAKRIQTMANNINAIYPGRVKGYAFPFQNSTTCSYSQTWVNSNSLNALYAPMDSGAEHVSYYGGFGMPTIVLLGGTDHKVLFSTLDFSTSDTTIMKNKILELINSTGTNEFNENIPAFTIFPNPAHDHFTIHANSESNSAVSIDLIDMTGKQTEIFGRENFSGILNESFDTKIIATGLYFIKLQVNGQQSIQKLNIVHD